MKALKVLMMAPFSICSISTIAQNKKTTTTKTVKKQKQQLKYSCPMHKDVIIDKVGQDDQYIMNFRQDQIETNEKIRVMKHCYCPMHEIVISDQPSKCSKCGMGFIKLKKKEIQMRDMKFFTRSIHTCVIFNQSG